MLRGEYRITIAGKVLIVQLFLFFIGSICGLMWKTYTSNKQWDKLIFRGVEIGGFHLKNRTVKEDETLIKSQYIDPLMKKSITILANNKSYILDNSRLIKAYTIQSPVISSFDFEKEPSIYEKSNILKKGVSQLYNVDFIYDESYIKDSIKTIEKDCNREAVNASIQGIDGENIKVNSSVKGSSVDTDALEKEIKEKFSSKNNSDVTILVPIEESEAAISTDEISTINAQISTFTTSFSSSSRERANNIELAAKLINGTLLMPGEVFSFNDRVGERRKDRGFMTAAVIVDNKIDSGIGGGICQVSSTLYNAVLKTGIKPLERTAHSLPSSYVKLGLDATVDWNNIDFKFQNTLKYPMYIQSYTKGKNLYINIYANSSLLSRKYVISSNVYKKMQTVINNVGNGNLTEGKTTTAKQAHNGYKVRVTRDIYENEKLVASEIISDDEYPRVQ